MTTATVSRRKRLEVSGERDERVALSVGEFARTLGVGVRTVWRLISTKRLRSIRIGRRVLIPRTELNALLERGGAA